MVGGGLLLIGAAFLGSEEFGGTLVLTHAYQPARTAVSGCESIGFFPVFGARVRRLNRLATALPDEAAADATPPAS